MGIRGVWAPYVSIMYGLYVQCYWLHWQDPSPVVFPSPVPALMSPSPGRGRDEGPQPPREGQHQPAPPWGPGCWVLHTNPGLWLGGEALLGPLGLRAPQTAPGSQTGASRATFASHKAEPRALRRAVPRPSSLRLPRCPPTSCTCVLASHARVQASPRGPSGAQRHVAFPHKLVGASIHGVGHWCPLAHPSR